MRRNRLVTSRSRSSWCSSVGPDRERTTGLAMKRRLQARIDSRRVPAAYLSEVLAEVEQRAFERGRGGASVVGAALIAVEAVVGCVEVDLDFRMRLLEGLDALDRDVRILIAEMRHRRHRGPARWLAAHRHAAAVVGDRRRQAAYFLGRAPDQEAAPAVADDADLAGPGDVVDRSLDVLQ